jgi:hypothetical protein
LRGAAHVAGNEEAGMPTTYTNEEIERRLHDFERANHRDHVRFVLGAAVVAIAITLLVVMMLYGMQGWAV